MEPSRLAVILLLGVLPLSAARQCCIPSVIEAQASHCSHEDQNNAPAPAACKGLDEAVFERLPNGVQADLLRGEISSLPALSDDAPVKRNEWISPPGNDSGPPADLAFLHHSPLLI